MPCAKLRTDGLQSVDEKLIFQTIAAQRALIAEAKLRTRAERWSHARSAAPKAPPAPDPPDPNESADTDDALAPFAVDDWS